jgi:hypothetical protein
MNILSPEYGKSRLDPFFKGEILIRDYSKIKGCEDKYPIWGVCVLAYSANHNDMNVRIHYLPSNQINFEIEVNQQTVLNSTWKNDDVTDSTYDYFVQIFSKMMKDMEETRYHLSKFASKGWIKLEKKLNEII